MKPTTPAPPAKVATPDDRVAEDPDEETDAERWRWAVERMPELAGLEESLSTDFSGQVDSRGRVVLYSPNLDAERVKGTGYKRCSPLEFLLHDRRLVTRLPLGGGVATPDVSGDHVVLALGGEVEHERVLTKGGAMGHVSSGCGSPTMPTLSDSTPSVLRYGAMPVTYGAQCDYREVEHSCTDGSKTSCSVCDLILVELSGDARGYDAGGPNINRPGCDPCPPAPSADDLDRLDEIVSAGGFMRRFEGGEEFYRDRKACLAAAGAPRWPAPPATDHVHGFALHPDLARVCSQRTAIALNTGGMLEVHWSLYATERAPKRIATWYGARLGKPLVAGKGTWTAELGASGQPVHGLAIAAPGAPGPTCGRDAPKGTRTLVRVSTVVRR